MRIQLSVKAGKGIGEQNDGNDGHAGEWWECGESGWECGESGWE